MTCEILLKAERVSDVCAEPLMSEKHRVGVGFLEGRDFYRFTPIHMGGYFYHFTRILRTYFYHFTHQAQISLRALRTLCNPLHSSQSKL